jgi:Zn-finger nucleic acid-binding protein
MKCPACPDSNLLMTDRQGVEIDYCPACRGVWLDRGELDKLLTARQPLLHRRLSVWCKAESNLILETRITVAISAITTSEKNRG